MTVKKIDVSKIMRFFPLGDLVGQVVDLRQNGSELKGLCPFHKENTPSFTIFTGSDGKERYACMGCGARGDHVQFLMDYHGQNFKEAASMLEELSGGAGMANSDNASQRFSQRPAPKEVVWEPCAAESDIPSPKSIDVNKDGKWISTPVLGAWAYRDEKDNLLGYACRVETVPGKKEVIPMTHKVNKHTGEIGLKPGALPYPRSLYGAELLAKYPKANIVLAEGEKATDAGRRFLESFGVVVISWPGGCKAVDKADWSILAGRKIVGWPDCDSQRDGDGVLRPYHEQPGMAAMLRIAELVKPFGCDMKIVAVPQPGEGEGHWPNGHDFADLEIEGWTPAGIMSFLKSNLKDPNDIAMLDPEEPYELPYSDLVPPSRDEPPLDDYYANYISDEDEEALSADVPSDKLQPLVSPGFFTPKDGKPYRALGWDNGKGYYLSDSISQIISLAASQHTSHNLLQLADLSYWEDRFGEHKKSGVVVNWTQIADCVMREARAKLIFKPDAVRGRGAWWDRGKWAVHLGDRVVMGDGENPPVSNELCDIESNYIYQRAVPLNMAFSGPIESSESLKLSKICERLRWQAPINGRLLAGYIFLAPICGALNWRSHVWITGGAGTGKSFVIEQIVSRVLNGIALTVQGNTTEAGVRQLLEHDALPIIWDEFESDNKKTEMRTEDVMDMMTRSSSESNAVLAKGGSDGKATTYKTRSMFCFASISVGIKNPAAESRVAILGLTQAPQTEEAIQQFHALSDDIVSTLTPEYIKGLQARAIRMIPVIRHNTKIFSDALTKLKGNKRFGDQFGTLLAGCYALHRTNEVTPEYAYDYVSKQDWKQVKTDEIMTDKMLCLQRILSAHIKVEVNVGTRTRTVIELIVVAMAKEPDPEMDSKQAKSALGRSGIVAFQDKGGQWELRVARSHPEVMRMLTDTPWRLSYPQMLEDLPGAVPRKSLEFAKQKMNCVTIPMGVVFPAGGDTD